MALRLYSCSTCKVNKKTFAASPEHCGVPMVSILSVPEAKFMEARDLDRKKFVLKDQDRMLKQRAKNYIRDVEMHDMIQSNSQETAKQMGWLNEKGLKRTKIDEM